MSLHELLAEMEATEKVVADVKTAEAEASAKASNAIKDWSPFETTIAEFYSNIIDQKKSDFWDEIEKKLRGTDLSRTVPRFDIGDRVLHQTFGPGTVISVDGNKCEVGFDAHGIKRIIDSFISPID